MSEPNRSESIQMLSLLHSSYKGRHLHDVNNASADIPH